MNKNGIIVLAAAFLITVAVLVFAVGPYKRGPVYKPYWEQINITDLALQGEKIGVVVYRGNGGWAIFGYQDNINMTQRGQLLSVLKQLILEAERQGYTVVLAPWGVDNKTDAVLSALYSGVLTPQEYLAGANTTAPINRSAIQNAENYALMLERELGSYTAYPGISQTPTTPPIIYAYLVWRGCSYPVYEPFEPLRDSNYTSWAYWVQNAIVNLPTLVGQPGCSD
ncbi:MAG: hypothetical protein QXP98_04765 [Thermoproteus sp.]